MTFSDVVVAAIQKVPALTALVILMPLDILTGIIHAFIRKEINSSASFQGMLKKILMLALVACGCVMETFNDSVPWGQVIALFWCVTEMMSISENVARSGLPMPKSWTDALAKMHGDVVEKPAVTVGVVPIDPPKPKKKNHKGEDDSPSPDSEPK